MSNPTSFQTILNKYRKFAFTERDKGDKFETASLSVGISFIKLPFTAHYSSFLSHKLHLNELQKLNSFQEILTGDLFFSNRKVVVCK